MEKKQERRPWGRRKAYYSMRMRRAIHLLLFRRHAKPGAKGWELRKALGPDYMKIIKVLDNYLEKLDLKIKIVFEDMPEGSVENPSSEQLNKARFYITLRGTLTPRETKLLGWRIDDIAALAIAISYIISKDGKVPRKDVEEILKSKLPGWRVEFNLNRFIRYGYLGENGDGQLFLDWRTRAEVDEQKLIELLLRTDTQR
ncbi:TPA: hypothetical protein EYP70_02570 [Candidatus Bathyarchaeota archaeon]|nr:hypothetical protein [Candidatus Bathyarchaeota archaeon]